MYENVKSEERRKDQDLALVLEDPIVVPPDLPSSISIKTDSVGWSRSEQSRTSI